MYTGTKLTAIRPLHWRTWNGFDIALCRRAFFVEFFFIFTPRELLAIFHGDADNVYHIAEMLCSFCVVTSYRGFVDNIVGHGIFLLLKPFGFLCRTKIRSRIFLLWKVFTLEPKLASTRADTYCFVSLSGFCSVLMNFTDSPIRLQSGFSVFSISTVS